jgi:hypothetical protein
VESLWTPGCLILRFYLSDLHKDEPFADMNHRGAGMQKVISYISFTVIFCFSQVELAQAQYFGGDQAEKTRCEWSGGHWTSYTEASGIVHKFCEPKAATENTGAAGTKGFIPPSDQAGSLALGESCNKDTTEAVSECKFDNTPELKPVMAIASGIKAQLNQNAASPAVLCSKMGNMAQALDAAVGAFNGYCSTGYAKCQQSCEADLAEAKSYSENPTYSALAEAAIKKIKENQKQCASLASNINDVAQNIGNYAQLEQMKAQTCGQLTADPNAALCKANPNLVICKNTIANCSDPTYAASNTVCICQKNPGDSRCGNTANSAMANLSSKSYSDTGPGADGSAGDFGGMGGDFSGGVNNVDALAGKPAEGGAGPGRGGSKAGLDVGGGGQGGGRGGAGGGGGSGINAKIIGGYGFGGGAGGYGTGSGNGSGSNQPGVYRHGALGPNGKPVDLRQFMPGGRMDPSRALAGVSGPDGITGPNTDIWKKINVRYFSVSPSLLP